MKRIAIVILAIAICASLTSNADARAHTYGGHLTGNIEQAVEASKTAVAPLLEQYSYLHARVLARRQTAWELAKFLGDVSDDLVFRSDTALGEAKSKMAPPLNGEEAFNQVVAIQLKTAIERTASVVAQRQADLNTILEDIDKIKNSKQPVPIPRLFTTMSPFQLTTYEAKLNLAFVEAFHPFDPDPYRRFIAKSKLTLASEFRKRAKLLEDGPSPQIPFLLTDKFDVFTHRLNTQQFESSIQEFRAKGFDLLLSQRRLQALRLLAKKFPEPTSTTFFELSKTEPVRLAIERLIDTEDLQDREIITRFTEVVMRNAGFEEVVRKHIVDTFSKAGEVYGQTIEVWSYTFLRKAARDFLVVTPVFCGDNALLNAWENGTQGLETNKTAKCPVDGILQIKKDLEAGFRDFLQEAERSKVAKK